MKKRLYEVYNGLDPHLIKENDSVEARSGADAVRIALKKLGIKYTQVIRSGSNFVSMRATPYRVENNKKYSNGKASWFEVWNNNTLIT